MVTHRGIHCQLTTIANRAIPEARRLANADDPPDLVRATVEMYSRQPFIVKWRAMEPITAWCEVWLVSPTRCSEYIAAATFMDKQQHNTQTRSSEGNLQYSTEMRIGQARRYSDDLGKVRLELRRVQDDLKINNTASLPNGKPGRTQVNVQFVDNPEDGARPFVTFEFSVSLKVTPLMSKHRARGIPMSDSSPSPSQCTTLSLGFNSVDVESFHSESSTAVATKRKHALESQDAPELSSSDGIQKQDNQARFRHIERKVRLLKLQVEKESLALRLANLREHIRLVLNCTEPLVDDSHHQG